LLLGSYGGSQTVTVNGSGFSRDSKVKICSQECSSQKYVSTNAIECTTPEKLVTDQSGEAKVICWTLLGIDHLDF